MEERHSSPPPKNLPLMITASPESQSTYIVQIPRDQVYRIPPPENALIVEEYHTRSIQPPKHTRFRTIFLYVIIPIVLISILVGISINIVRVTMYSPHSPRFVVSQIYAKGLSSRYPEYDVTLRASNPNPRMSVTYRGPGTASLLLDDDKIGNGKLMLPNLRLKEKANANVDIHLSLSGKGIELDEDVRKSLNGTTNEKVMLVKVEVGIEINSWAKNVKMDLMIECDFKVRNLLGMKNAKVTFTDCRTDSF